jgi:hypothetical protein
LGGFDDDDDRNKGDQIEEHHRRRFESQMHDVSHKTKRPRESRFRFAQSQQTDGENS